VYYNIRCNFFYLYFTDLNTAGVEKDREDMHAGNGGTRGGEQGPRPPLKSVKFFNPHLYSKAQHKGQSMQRCFVLKFFGYRP